MGVPHDALYKPKTIDESKSTDAGDLELPTIDASGQVHTYGGSQLPDPKDFKKYPKDKLKQFLRDLKNSVQQRDFVNRILGGSKYDIHLDRIGEEKILIKALEKFLSGS